MLGVVAGIAHAMIHVPSLPNFGIDAQFSFCAEGKSAFDQLNGALERRVSQSGKKEMNVIRHYDKFVDEELVLISVAQQSCDKEICHALGLEKRTIAVGVSRDEIRS
jgi:hypothetical protein